MTHEQFAALPNVDKQPLAEHVQRHVKNDHRG
jgi:hypothetical protein